jgi:NAD(P)-dependent dehydrogenase (short-subunit alcohol dehydrogenase family)
MNTQQRVAVITGASQGIGEGLVAGFRRLGYAVVANSRLIGASDDPMVLTIAGDISAPGVGQRIVDAALDRFGRIDTVVNNAGIFIAKPFTDYTDDDFDAVTGVNLRGSFEVSRAAVTAMLAQGDGGHVVNISTSLVDHANSAVPSALASLTKGGLNAVTKSLAIEYAGRGIRSTRSRSASFASFAHPCTTSPRTTRWRRCIRSAGSVRSTTSSTPCFIWRTHRSSPARCCTSMAARARETDEHRPRTARCAR